MLVMTMIFMMTMKKMSPMNMSLMIIYVSLMMSVTMLEKQHTMMTSMAMIIAFSTGMMMLFCYCATLSNFEKKNNKSTNMMTMMVLAIWMTSDTEETWNTSLISNSMNSSQMTFTMIAMIMVMVSMLSINKAMFSPQKMLMQSY